MIGIFDSGVGGLGIYKEIKKLMPNESILYLADSKNCPYGEKTQKEIKKIALDNTRFLIGKGCNIIVIACNTASTIALQFIREDVTNLHFQGVIIGVVPVVKTAAEVSKNKQIGILATKKTVESKYLHDLVNQFCPKEKGFRVFYQAANELVGLVENCRTSILSSSSRKRSVSTSGIQNKLDSRWNLPRLFHRGGNDIIKKYLQPFIRAKVDVVALGCTHFPFLRKEIEKMMGAKVKILDSNGAVARQVARIATSNMQHVTRKNSRITNLELQVTLPKYQFYTSGNSATVKPVMEKLLGEKIDRVLKKR